MLQEKKTSGEKEDRPENTATSLPANTSENENVIAAHEQAEQDIEQDPDLSLPGPNDDLDEGETARLGEDRNDLV